MLGPRFHPREPVLGILRGVLSSHLLARASLRQSIFSVFFFLFTIWGHTPLLGNTVALFISHTLYGCSWQDNIFSVVFQCISFVECSFQCESSPLLLPAVMWAGVEGQCWDFHEARGCPLKGNHFEAEPWISWNSDRASNAGVGGIPMAWSVTVLED